MEVLREGYSIPFSSIPPLPRVPIPFCELFPELHQGEGSSRGDLVSDTERGSRASPSLSGLLRPYVRCLEGIGFMGTYHRPFSLEQVCPPNKVQDGDQSVGPPGGLEGRLDILHRSEGCLP